jgi:myosin heavy subunit
MSKFSMIYHHFILQTYIGDILIAVNPLKPIEIYGKLVSDQYKACIDNIRINLSPHVFATAEQCYREMLRTQKSQCILISGTWQ